MAILSMITCEGCGKRSEVNHSPADAPPTLCSECRARVASSKRDQHFAELDALPLAERLRRVEAWIYDYRPQWVPPPRF